VNGVKNASRLLLFPRFDIIWGLPVDYMHAICLGVAKKLTWLWVDSSQRSRPWFVGDQVAAIDHQLQASLPARLVKSLPRSLREKQHWKAVEYRNWLLYFAPVVLEGFLPPVYLQHLLIVVRALHVLLSNYIDTSILDIIEGNLKIFLQAFEKLYGLATLSFPLSSGSHVTSSLPPLL